jgi:hypothetical protein
LVAFFLMKKILFGPFLLSLQNEIIRLL